MIYVTECESLGKGKLRIRFDNGVELSLYRSEARQFKLSEDAATKDADGNESINAKTLNFTATALDNANRTYKLKGFGSTPGTITKDMFDPKPSSSSV